MRRVCLRSFFTAISFLGFAQLAEADDCKLQQFASVDFTEDASGRILFPVSIEGTQKSMALDTGAEMSAVDPQVASDLHLITHPILQGMAFNTGGAAFTQEAVLHSFDIGKMHAQDAKFLVWPSPLSDDGSVAGVFGADFMHHYDIDIDFGAHKLGIFSQDHCPGKVIYWPAPSVAVVPMRVVTSAHIIVPVTLDSHEFDAMLDTGGMTHLSESAAKAVFGLVPNSPGMTEEANSGLKTPVYRYKFKSIGLEGIAISNPTVYIWDDLEKYSMRQAPHLGSRLSDAGEQTAGMTDMILGASEFKNLHVYIAYREQKLYISSASPAGGAPTTAAGIPSSSAATH
jgi:hypothetical protein